VSQVTACRFAFLTNHAQVLLCIAGDPGIRLREIGAQVGITERAAHRIVGELELEGYVTRRREGRRNHYTIEPHLPLPDTLARERQVGDLLAIVGTAGAAAKRGESKRRAT
jgi:DNA-binding IclR family transcriptional regulator